MAGRQAVKAYLDLVSQACRAVLIFLKDNKIPHTVETLPYEKVSNIVYWGSRGLVVRESDL